MARGCISRKAAKIMLCVTLPILVASLVLTVAFGSIYNVFLKKEISLGKGSLATQIWKDIPLPIYEKLYFFNITNADTFVDGTDQYMNVSEVGPYTYKSHWIKNETRWNPNNTVSYREVRTYHFIPEMSNGTEDDEIDTLNGPMILGAKVAESYGMVGAILAYGFFKVHGETIVIRKTIRELVYDGYEDPIIKDGKYAKKDMPFKDGKFAWLYGKNASDDGLFTVFTGVDDASKTNFIDNWNGKEQLEFWKADSCNMMNGTSIETGPPIDGYQETYTFFQSLLCRSLTFNYTDDQTHYGILSKRFTPTYNILANSSENPDNHCFEVKSEHASGVLDVSTCQFDAPVFISFPHFYLADPSYLKMVNGLDPNEVEHGSYISVEPVTGFSIDLAVRFQINLEISESPYILQFRHVAKGIFPVFWAEISMKIDEDFADFLKSSVENPKIIAYSVLIAVEVICLILISASVFVLSAAKKKEDSSPLINAKHRMLVVPSDPEYIGCKIRDYENDIRKEKESENAKNSNHSYNGYDSKSTDYDKFSEQAKESEKFDKSDKLSEEDKFAVHNLDIHKDIPNSSTTL